MCSRSMKIWTGRIDIKFSLVVTSGEGRKGVEEGAPRGFHYICKIFFIKKIKRPEEIMARC